MSLFQIFSIILQTLSLFSVIFLALQIYASKKQAKESHEEQRRVQTISVLNQWNNSLKKEMRLAEKIVETLDEQSCRKLYDYTPFYVDNNTHNMLCQLCSHEVSSCNNKCKKNKNNKYKVNGEVLTELRGHVTSYLNSLEIVAVAWQQAIVDRETIETQFIYLYNPGKKSALKTYRKVAGGGNSFPALNSLYEKIEKNQSKSSNNKQPQ